MSEFESSVYIDRPLQDVFDVVVDFDNLVNWQGGIDSSGWVSEGPFGVGSTAHFVTRFLGRKIETELQVSAWEPPHKAAVKGVNGPFPYEITWTLEPQGEGTLLTSASRSEHGGFFRLAEGLVVRQLKKQVDANNNSLKLLMESGQL